MDNRINEIRKKIRAPRVSMLEAEAIMHEQINRDEECSEIAGEIMVMRSVMSALLGERQQLGDREPIFVTSPSSPDVQIYAVSHRDDLHSRRYQYAHNYLSRDEARRIAKAISRLPELLKRPQY